TTLECSGNVAIIANLHEQIMGNARKSLDLAIQVGGLLTQQKETVGHGQWEKWVETHLPFGPRTASNYVRLYRERERIKSESVSDLTDAYKLLAGPTPMDRHRAEEISARIRYNLHAM